MEVVSFRIGTRSDSIAIEVGAGKKPRGTEEMSLELLHTNSCYFSNPAGKSPDYDLLGQELLYLEGRKLHSLTSVTEPAFLYSLLVEFSRIFNTIP